MTVSDRTLFTEQMVACAGGLLMSVLDNETDVSRGRYDEVLRKKSVHGGPQRVSHAGLYSGVRLEMPGRFKRGNGLTPSCSGAPCRKRGNWGPVGWLP